MPENLTNAETPVTAPLTVAAVRRKRKLAAPRSPRTVDPEIKALQQQHKQAVADLKNRRRSAAILKTILDKRLAQLTQDDKNKLFDELKQCATPSLNISK